LTLTPEAHIQASIFNSQRIHSIARIAALRNGPSMSAMGILRNIE
jgi:hypothetical protein